MMVWVLLSRLVRIMILDLVLSGDNAVVIGMATIQPMIRSASAPITL